MIEETMGVEEESSSQVATEEHSSGVEASVAEEQRVDSDVDKNWKETRETLKTQSEEIRALRAQLAQNMQAKEVPKDGFSGKDEDDIPTYGEMKKIIAEREASYQQQLSELSVYSKYPDAKKVIEKYGKTLSPAVKDAIMRSSAPYEAAYEACIGSAEYYKDTLKDAQHPDAKRVLENAKKPGSASTVGGAGALSKASLYENLSDAELLGISEKYKLGRR